MVWF